MTYIYYGVRYVLFFHMARSSFSWTYFCFRNTFLYTDINSSVFFGVDINPCTPPLLPIIPPLLRLPSLALQPTVGFGLWNNILPFFLSFTSSLHLLTHITYLFLLPLSILSWVFPFAPSLPVLEWRSFWASYPPPFSLGDLTSLSFDILSIVLYFLLRSSLLVLGSSYFSIPRFHI